MIFSFLIISGPNFLSSSSAVVRRWQPVETRSVILAPGLPFLISASMGGIITLLGTGRVWSLHIITTFFLPSAITLSFGVPIGFSSARITSSCGEYSGL
jgi:hypothetical protein